MSNVHYTHIHATCIICGGCVYECEHRVRTTITTTGVTDLVKHGPETKADPQESAHPNTDSRKPDLDELFRGVKSPTHSMKDLKQAIDRYTANKQRQLLEWVEQEVVDKINAVCPDVEIVKELQRQFIKNKKEEL